MHLRRLFIVLIVLVTIGTTPATAEPALFGSLLEADNFRTGVPGALQALQATQLQRDLSAAMLSMQQSKGRLPRDLQDLLDHQLVFFAPRRANGSPMPFVEIGLDDAPPPDSVGVAFLPQGNIRVVMMGANGDPETPIMRESPGSRGRIAVGLVEIPLTEDRIMGFTSAVQNRIATFVNVHEVFPSAWKVVLDEFEWVPIDHRWEVAAVETGGQDVILKMVYEPTLQVLESSARWSHHDFSLAFKLEKKEHQRLPPTFNLDFNPGSSNNPTGVGTPFLEAAIPADPDLPPGTWVPWRGWSQAEVQGSEAVTAFKSPWEAYVNLHPDFPVSVQQLVDLHASFHLPLADAGRPIEVVQLEEPAGGPHSPFGQEGMAFLNKLVNQRVNAIGVYLNGPVFFVVPQLATGLHRFPSWPSNQAALDRAIAHLRAPVRRPVAELRAEFDRLRTEHGGKLPWEIEQQFAKDYIAQSGQFNERRVDLFAQQIRGLMGDWARMTGTLPGSWEGVLEKFQLYPNDYAASPTPLVPRDNQMGCRIEVDQTQTLLRITLKPSIPATEVRVYRFSWDFEEFEVDVVDEPLTQELRSNQGWVLLFDTLLHTDV